MNACVQMLLALAAQAQEPVPVAVLGSGIPFLDDLIRGGPYAIIAVLIWVVRVQYKELREERAARIGDRNQSEADKQTLNDKVLNVSRETTTAVLQNTEVQRQLVVAIAQIQEDT